eukprot:scaffold2088_cov399-Prasinococcus_capsulatus_cf.AAC.39
MRTELSKETPQALRQALDQELLAGASHTCVTYVRLPSPTSTTNRVLGRCSRAFLPALLRVLPPIARRRCDPSRVRSGWLLPCPGSVNVHGFKTVAAGLRAGSPDMYRDTASGSCSGIRVACTPRWEISSVVVGTVAGSLAARR